MTEPVSVKPTSPMPTVVEKLSAVPGVVAIALCGSRARGSATPTSDFDVMVFSDTKGSTDKDKMAKALAELGPINEKSIQKPVPDFIVEGHKVELFFRYVDQFAAEVARSKTGQFKRSFNPLHTLGFVSTVVVSYLAYCKPLWDPDGKLQRLIDSVHPYPEPLRKKMIDTFLTDAKLTLMQAQKVRSVQDLVYLIGIYGRMMPSWSMVLFAANRRYPIIDKDQRSLVPALPNVPQNFEFRRKSILRALAAGELKEALEEANKLHTEVAAVARRSGKRDAPPAAAAVQQGAAEAAAAKARAAPKAPAKAATA
jgi:predicted nucleotidyltransferase